jgi:glycerate kinase
VVGAVQTMAAQAGVQVAVIAGSVAGRPPEAGTVELTALAGSEEEAIRQPARWLTEAGRQLAGLLEP